MKRCKKCGGEYADGVKYCTRCGEEFKKRTKKQERKRQGHKIWRGLMDGYLTGYLVMNLLFIGLISIGVTDRSAIIEILYGLVLYVISVLIALSPIGEWIFCFQSGCRKISRFQNVERFNKLFEEVCENAKRRGKKIPKDIKLYLCEDKFPNAFAIGRKTICITTGLEKLSDEEIKIALARELGHLFHHDTEGILVISAGNQIVFGIVLGFRTICDMMCWAMQIRFGFYRIIFDCCAIVFAWIWTKTGVLLAEKLKRKNMDEANRFAEKLGYITIYQVTSDKIKGE